ncbi:MAG: T9SS type A sorting domain-containing protein, partial [Flavipsychrobacter sp.]
TISLTSNFTVSSYNTVVCCIIVSFSLKVNTILVPSVTLTASPDSFISTTTTTTFTATAVNAGTKPVFRWYQDGIIVTGDSANTYIVHGGITDKDSITVRLHSNAVCALPDTASAHIKLLPKRRLTVSNIISENNDIQLYPNPNDGNFILTALIGNIDKQASIEIVDVAGRSVYKEAASVNNGKLNKHISLKNNTPAGTYTLYIHSGDSSKHISFTLQK